MTFDQALATQPEWLRLWLILVGWRVRDLRAPSLFLLITKTTRRDALVIFLTNFGNIRLHDVAV